MNENEMEIVLGISRARLVSFDQAADHYMLYGTSTATSSLSEDERRERERATWNAEVDRRKKEKTTRKS